jgi:hypothetical protein
MATMFFAESIENDELVLCGGTHKNYLYQLMCHFDLYFQEKIFPVLANQTHGCQVFCEESLYRTSQATSFLQEDGL